MARCITDRFQARGWVALLLGGVAWLLADPRAMTGRSLAGDAPPARLPSGEDPAWRPFLAALTRFHEGGSRRGFLGDCRKVLAEHPGNPYEKQLQSLVQALEREAKAPRPAFLDKRPGDRTEEERIQCWIHELRDLAADQWSDPGYPTLFSFTPSSCQTAADQLVAIGPPAIPYLVEAVGDETVTRTVGARRHYAPSRYTLRRQDVAVHCLERVVGCRFYIERGTGEAMESDDPKRRDSAIASVRAWWAASKGASQAQMIRNQLALREKNLALSSSLPTHDLAALAMLEGPEAVIEKGRRLLAEDRDGLNSPVVELMMAIDPQTPIRAALDRFWKSQSSGGDYLLLYKYGGQEAYRRIARRYEQSGALDPSGWVHSDQARAAAKHGRNWAIPILARMLEEAELPRKYVGNTAGLTDASAAAELFQELTGRDSGYRPADRDDIRRAAIGRARQWWLDEGRKELAAKIAEDHPPVVEPGDLLLSDDEIAFRISAIEEADRQKRNNAIASLGEVYSYRTQRAILKALIKADQAGDRVEMLKILLQHPSPWHFPVLAELLDRDADPAVRVLAARCMEKSLRDKGGGYWWIHWIRLETREMGLRAARRIARDPGSPADVRSAAVDMLLAWCSWVDLPLLRDLAGDPVFQRHEALRRYLEQQNDLSRRMPKPKEPAE